MLLTSCAADTLEDLVRHELEHSSHAELVKALSSSTARGVQFEVTALRQALLNSRERIDDLLTQTLSEESLVEKEQVTRLKLQGDLSNGNWLNSFKGRDILKRFLQKELNGVIRYDLFRNMIVSDMVDAGYKPQGMSDVLNVITAA